MDSEFTILAWTAISIGFFHTILGPDHYIPFIAMSKAGNWTKRKTIIVTFLSGLGHVFSSVLLGFIGIGLGVALNILEEIESVRGEIAAWMLISFGFLYFLWGIKNIIRNKKHSHWHHHSEGTVHNHGHSHCGVHSHAHENSKPGSITPWIIFTIFIFGPCEALIPILIYPAASISYNSIIIITLLFGLSTIITMMSIVIFSVYGMNFIKFNGFEKYSHAMAGAIIFLSGISVQFLGL